MKAHVSGYEVQIKSFADMLSLGAERRKRWRQRHLEFIQSINAARGNNRVEYDDESNFVYKQDQEATHAGKHQGFIVENLSDHSGLLQCEHCQRRFNEAAYSKHIEQCKTKPVAFKSQQSEEQREARERFMRRMKVCNS